MKYYAVRLIPSEVYVKAKDEDEAVELAIDLAVSDARTHLDYGFCWEDGEVEEIDEEDCIHCPYEG